MENYIRIPTKVFYHKKLPVGAKLLYAEIARYCKENGYCQKKNVDLAELFGVTKPTITSWIKILEKRKLIKCKRRKKYLRILFLQETTEKSIKKVLKNLTKEGVKKLDGRVLNNLTGGVKKLHDISKDICAREHLEDARVHDSNLFNDDFSGYTKEWIDESGQKRGTDFIDEN